ncbi:MAG: DUF3035 domain-containing protein [Caulobacteraceae bacterium]|nr:DUF3035 domain-containing protein [Caulobacter sp.]RYF92793.1 MAG: DUF3035 domain-containing protein [Caulobacteraceae bacterium]
MKLNRAIVITALVASAGLAGCQSASKALGMSKITPDEFKVVTKAPLVVPPDYALRPPAPGEPRPAELEPDSAARASAQARVLATERSDGEKVLVARAGANNADPLVRYVVDDEFGDVAHKEKSFADTVMFWRKDKPPTASADPSTAPVVDAAAEEARIKTLTGGKAVVIKREKTGWVKLPGL